MGSESLGPHAFTTAAARSLAFSRSSPNPWSLTYSDALAGLDDSSEALIESPSTFSLCPWPSSASRTAGLDFPSAKVCAVYLHWMPCLNSSSASTLSPLGRMYMPFSDRSPNPVVRRSSM